MLRGKIFKSSLRRDIITTSIASYKQMIDPVDSAVIDVNRMILFLNTHHDEGFNTKQGWERAILIDMKSVLSRSELSWQAWHALFYLLLSTIVVDSRILLGELSGIFLQQFWQFFPSTAIYFWALYFPKANFKFWMLISHTHRARDTTTRQLT